jgi:hypothetical protein
MKQFSIVILLIFSMNAFGQELTKGLIMPNSSGSFKSCCVYIPISGLAAFDKPNGKIIAQIEQGTPDNNDEVYKPVIRMEDKLTEFAYTNFHMVGYEVMAIVYTDSRDGFVQTNNNYWLKIEELESKGLVATNWMEYLIHKEDVLGWYANDPGLNLRAKPSITSEALITLKGNLFEITPTKETNGLWCKVTVKEYKEHPCSGEDDLVIQTLTGWVKLLSNEQTPNVWNYGKGC